MPTGDDRLRDALRDGAREPTTVDGVADGVRAKWSRRRTMRRVEHAALAGALAAGLLVVAVVAIDPSNEDRNVAVAPARGAVPVVRVDDDAGTHKATATPLHVTPNEGYLRGPLLANGDRIELAAYDREGSSFTFPPSRIVRIETDGTFVDRVDLQGEILSFADGEGARWALTHDKTVLGPEDPEFRVKRIGPGGEVASNPVPPGEQPVGRIAAGGGGVWVPVRDGVLRFDIATGAFAAKIPLTTVTDHRAVDASGLKFVYATDGNRQVRLDPASDAPGGSIGALDAGYDIVGAASATRGIVPYLLATNPAGAWVVAAGGGGITLPDGFTPTDIVGGDDVVWIAGLRGGQPTLLVIDPSADSLEIARTVRLANTSDATVVLTGPRAGVVASGGSIFRIQLPR